MKKYSVLLLLALLGLLLTGCPDGTTNGSQSTDTDVIDETLYSKLEGGWEVIERGNNFRSTLGNIVFTDEPRLEYYLDDLNHISYRAVVTELNDSTVILDADGWVHDYDYEIDADNELTLYEVGDHALYVKFSRIDDGLVARRIKFLLSFDSQDNSSFNETFWPNPYKNQILLYFPDACDPSSLIPTFEMTEGCTVTPNDNGKVTDFSINRDYTVTNSYGDSVVYSVVSHHIDNRTNMLANGDISMEDLFWWNWNDSDNPDLNCCYFDNEEIHAYVGDRNDNAWRYQVGYSSFNKFGLEYGRSYTVSFRAKASKNRPIDLLITENGDDLNNDGNNYSSCIDVEASLTTEYQDFTFSFIMRYPTNDDPSLKFYLAEETGDVWIDDVVLKEIDPLPQTICYEEDGEGYIQYSSCDASLNGWTWWHYYSNTNAIPANIVEVEYIKKSGSHWPAGVLFNHYDNSNLCHIQINTNGYYNIQEKYQNSNTTIVDWTYSDLINQGLNVSNKIRIEWNATTDSFDFCNHSAPKPA